jgi:hypothetical protein
VPILGSVIKANAYRWESIAPFGLSVDILWTVKRGYHKAEQKLFPEVFAAIGT